MSADLNLSEQNVCSTVLNPDPMDGQNKSGQIMEKSTLSNYFTEVSSEDPFEAVCELKMQSDEPKVHVVPQPTKFENPIDPSTLNRLRQRDAWLPSEATQTMLMNKNRDKANLENTEIKPWLIGKEYGTLQKTGSYSSHPYYSALARYLGETAAVNAISQIRSADHVNQGPEGLKDLIINGSYRPALDLTYRILSDWGYVEEKGGAVLTPFTVQIWLTRLALMIRIRNFGLAEQELSAFQNLDAPCFYFEYWPSLYPDRSGSIIPFSLRLLHAELPVYLNRPKEALDRLYYLLAVIDRMMSNLRKGYVEDGSVSAPNLEYRRDSLSLWTCRQVRVLSSCLSIYLSDFDYEAAIEVVHQLAVICSKSSSVVRGLSAVLGRIYLQMGDLDMAKSYLDGATMVADSKTESQLMTQKLFHEGLLFIGRNEYEQAKKLFDQILQIDPTSVAAANNSAVCALYCGQLTQAINTLETLTTVGLSGQPSDAGQLTDHAQSNKLGPSCLPNISRRFCLHDALVFNLSVLYEVESDASDMRKVGLLERLTKISEEPVNISAFKLPDAVEK